MRALVVALICLGPVAAAQTPPAGAAPAQTPTQTPTDAPPVSSGAAPSSAGPPSSATPPTSTATTGQGTPIPLPPSAPTAEAAAEVPATALQAERKPILLALDIDGKGVSALEAEAASQSVVRGLRELDVFDVLSAADVRELLAMERTRQLLAGDAKGSTVTELGNLFGSRHAVAGTMTRVGGELRVEIRLLDNADLKVLSQRALGPVKGIEEIATQLPGLAQELVGPLLEMQRGQLLVRTNEEAAEVLVDDVLVATTPMQAPVKLPRGQHRVQVRRDGFIAQTRGTRIFPEQVTTEEFLLIPSPDYAEAYAQRHGRLRMGALIATGTAVGLIGGAVLLDRFGTEPLYTRSFLPRQLALSNVTDLPAEVEGDADLLSLYTACGANPALCAVEAERLQTQLTLQQAATGGMVVLGIASAATAGYLFFTGKDPNRYANLVASFAVGGEGGTFVLSGSF